MRALRFERTARVVVWVAVCLVLGISRPGFARQDGTQAPLEFQPRTYKMVSIPVNVTDKGFGDVLEDDYGPYNINVWRLFRYNSITEDYDEYPDINGDFSRGTAVWLINQDGRTFDIDGETSTDLTEPVPLVVYPGWNQIGTPFPFPIACGVLLDEVPSLVPEIQDVERPVAFDGVEYQYNVSICRPWEGYFVYVRSERPVPIGIPPLSPGETAAKASGPVDFDPSSEYVLQVAAEVPATGLRDTQNFLGLLHDARAGRDAHDFSDAPPIEPYVRVAILEDGHRYAGNFVSPAGDGHVWDVEVRATRQDDPIEMHLVGEGTLPDGFERFVFDRDRHTVIPTDDGVFSLDARTGDGARHLAVVLGTRAFAERVLPGVTDVPQSFALMQNHPNPFNPQTSITYRLGERAQAVLDVYNLLGQRVRRLVAGTQEAGTHTVAWDGTDDEGKTVASGVYLYRLRAGTFTAVRTMVLMR